jgi:hypothetical protein
MEKHFLQSMMRGRPKFRAEPWYNPHGDCVVFQLADEAFVAERIDELLTVYHSVIDKRTIGFQIKGVQAMINKFGLDGLAVTSETDSDGVKSVSIAALLLAAYEEGPRTVGRRKAYSVVMECPTDRRGIPAANFQLA